MSIDISAAGFNRAMDLMFNQWACYEFVTSFSDLTRLVTNTVTTFNVESFNKVQVGDILYGDGLNNNSKVTNTILTNPREIVLDQVPIADGTGYAECYRPMVQQNGSNPKLIQLNDRQSALLQLEVKTTAYKIVVTPHTGLNPQASKYAIAIRGVITPAKLIKPIQDSRVNGVLESIYVEIEPRKTNV